MNANEDLLCPITLELFDDPVTIPCCGMTFSRIPLSQSLKLFNKCPLCRVENNNFNVLTAQKNKIIEKMVENEKIVIQKKTSKNDIFEKVVLDYHNKKIVIYALIMSFQNYDNTTKENIIDDIIFHKKMNGLSEDDAMLLLDNFYNTYADFTFDFAKKFNDFLFTKNNINKKEIFLSFANFLIKFCKKFNVFPTLSECKPIIIKPSRESGLYCYGCDTIYEMTNVGIMPINNSFQHNYYCKKCGLDNDGHLKSNINILDNKYLFVRNYDAEESAEAKLIQRFREADINNKKTILKCKLLLIKTILGMSLCLDFQHMRYNNGDDRNANLSYTIEYSFTNGTRQNVICKRLLAEYKESENKFFRLVFSNEFLDRIINCAKNSEYIQYITNSKDMMYNVFT